MKYPVVKLSEIAEINPRRPVIHRQDNEPTSFIPMESVDAINGLVEQPEIRPYFKVKKGYTYLEDGDVIFAKITPCMQNGKHSIMQGLIDGFGFGSTEFHVIRVSDRVVPEWVHFFLRRKETLNAAKKTFTGAVGQQRVPGTFLDNLLLPLPDVSTQKELTALLSNQLEKVKTGREAAQKQYNEIVLLSRRHREFTLADLNNAGRVPLGDVLIDIESGKSLQTTERLAADNELGVLKVSAVSWGNFNPNQAKSIEGDYTPEDHHRVRVGDVLISRANTVELVGAVVRVAQDYSNRLLSDKTLRLVLDEDKCDPDYIVQVLRLPEARAHIEGNATGTSDSMRNISQNTIRATPIALPSLDEQRRIAARMKSVDQEIARLRQAVKAQLSDLTVLPQKLLAQVFEN